MLERYRTDYTGEHVLVKTVFKDGKKIQEREWVPNAVTNSHISNRAAVIGSDVDRTLFDYSVLERHQGGLLGTKRLQTYGSGDVIDHLKLNFYVNTDRARVDSLKSYAATNIVYSSTAICLNNPGLFYLIPYAPGLDDLSHAVYLAAFDKHEEVFLIGYNNDTPSINSNWINNLDRVIKTYKNTTFYVVAAESNIPINWIKNSNVKILTHRDFISHCDVF